MTKRFDTFPLDEAIQNALADLGFETATEIQEQAIPFLLDSPHSDVVALAQTGTGKTAAFGLPMIQNLEDGERKIQGVVLSPTRELALQIKQDFDAYTKHKPKVRSTAVYGGASIEQQMKDVKRGAEIVVATPGRLCDMLRRKKIDLSAIKTLVLDEADEMLNMGFKDDLDFILDHCPKERATWLFSATMSREVQKIAKNYMDAPHEMVVGSKNSGSSQVSFKYVVTQRFLRYKALKRIIDNDPLMYGIIFCRTRKETQDVAEQLIEDSYSALPLHGDMTQSQRDNNMQIFRRKQIRFLVATDVAARGIDVDNITHVIHFRLPDQVENFTHRSGRTGRAGNEGVSLAITTPADREFIRRCGKTLGVDMNEVKLPSLREVSEKKLLHKIHVIKTSELGKGFGTELWDKIKNEFEDISKEEILARVFMVEMKDLLSEDDEDLNASARSSSDSKRYFLNLGKKDNLSKEELVEMFQKLAGGKKDGIYAIDIMDTFTFFDSSMKDEKAIIKGFSGEFYKGRRIDVEVSAKKKGGGGGRRRNGGGGRSGGRSGGYGRGGGNRSGGDRNNKRFSRR